VEEAGGGGGGGERRWRRRVAAAARWRQEGRHPRHETWRAKRAMQDNSSRATGGLLSWLPFNNAALVRISKQVLWCSGRSRPSEGKVHEQLFRMKSGRDVLSSHFPLYLLAN